MKQCSTCKVTKPLEEFYTNYSYYKGKRTAHQYECTSCSKQRNQEWRRKNKAKVAAIHARCQRKPKSRYKNARRIAEKRGKEWRLTEAEYTATIATPCYYCDGYFGKVEQGSGLDRLDNSKGYEIGNVVSCCWVCNCVKSDIFTPEETKQLIALALLMRGVF